MQTPLRILNAPAPADRPDAAPPRAGQYVVDFGGETVTGMSARQVAALLESEQMRHIKVYRIHRALPDGTMELVGVSHARFNIEDGFLFLRETADAARRDFEQLRDAARREPPPCRARVHLAKLPDADRPYVTALLYPGEYADDMSAWLLNAGYQGGDRVEGGPSAASNYASDTSVLVVERIQLWGVLDGTLSEHGGEAVRSAATA